MSDAGKDIIFNIAQVTAGFLVSVILYRVLKGRFKGVKRGIIGEMSLIFALVIIAVLFPLDTYGILPVIAVMAAVGFELNHTAAFLTANAFFNMTVPFTNIAFSWKFGIFRLVFAVFAGILAGFILSMAKGRGKGLVKDKMPLMGCFERQGAGGIIKGFGRSIDILAPYLLAGVLANCIFNGYILNNVLEIIYTNKATSVIPKAFSSLDVTNFIFLIAMNIAVMLMNFIKLSALFVLFKFRGVLVYYIYYAFLALVLSVSIFM